MEPEPDTIEARACDWIAREDAGLTAEESRVLEDWLASDSRHRGAFVRAKAAWLDTERLGSLAYSPQSAHSGFAEPTSEVDDQARTNLSTANTAARGATRTLRFAASIAALTLIGGIVLYFWPSRSQIYASEIGEVRHIELADGSQLTLNTDTEATVRFKPAERDITLDRGEALFQVSHDATRPFLVSANGFVVKAIGTAFTVRVDGARADVVVTEGTVDISRNSDAKLQDVQRVSANSRVILTANASRPDIEPVAPDTVARELAWRDGMAAFAGEPLSVAVAEINRHSRHPILVDDPTLAARPVVGIFHANDAEAFANAAATTFGAEIVHTDGTIHLRSRTIE